MALPRAAVVKALCLHVSHDCKPALPLLLRRHR